MTDEELQTIRERHQAALAGPWQVFDHAREDIPALLAYIDQLRETITQQALWLEEEQENLEKASLQLVKAGLGQWGFPAGIAGQPLQDVIQAIFDWAGKPNPYAAIETAARDMGYV